MKKRPHILFPSMAKRVKIPLPEELTFDSARPPYPGHDYWAGHADYPFRVDAKAFDLVNAWWLCDAAILAYSEKSLVEGIYKARLKDAGFACLHWIEAGNTEAYVAEFETFAMVAFRGTESRGKEVDGKERDFRAVTADCITDAKFKLVESDQRGKVHSGFKGALDLIWKQMAAVLLEIQNRGKPLWFAGHSLGGALATLAADRFGAVAGLYTYGSPRVGDKSFGSDFSVPTYRFVNNSDIVTRVPLEIMGYVHVGQLKYIDHKGVIHEGVSPWEIFKHSWMGRVSHVFNGLGKLRLGFGSLAPAEILDHVPTYYSWHIWNSLPGVK